MVGSSDHRPCVQSLSAVDLTWMSVSPCCLVRVCSWDSGLQSVFCSLSGLNTRLHCPMEVLKLLFFRVGQNL